MKRAKIVCTIGPASSDERTLRSLVEAGMNVARINFSHGSRETHREICGRIRRISDKVAIMQDLQGPKIRVGDLGTGPISLAEGDEAVLVAGGKAGPGEIPLTYPGLLEDLEPGNGIYISDGLIHLEVQEVSGRDVRCRVVHGGTVTSLRGVNLPGVRISSPALTEKDRVDLESGLEAGVDYVALSFVREAREVGELRKLIEKAGSAAGIVAKIEKREAVESLGSIVDVSDGIMIARGDLGVEIPTEDVPVVQKSIVEECLRKGKPVITATQMLESMVSSERPTRAEASDVANAVLDGSDAVMLSAETATGIYPVRTVEVMSRIIERAEEYGRSGSACSSQVEPISAPDDTALADAICSGVAAVADDVGAEAIAVLTHSGRTARLIARRRPGIPIIALTDYLPVVRKMSLVWGVEAVTVEKLEETEKIFAVVREKVRAAGFSGKIVVSAGIPTRERRPSNTVHVIED